MSKHLVDIDPKLLERARAAAGTSTIRATVEAGLRALAAQEVALRHVRRLRKGALTARLVESSRASRVRTDG